MLGGFHFRTGGIVQPWFGIVIGSFVVSVIFLGLTRNIVSHRNPDKDSSQPSPKKREK